jgi:hypothetical protein
LIMTTLPDSHVAKVFRPGLGWAQGKLLPRVGAPVATVVHTTGGGIIARFEREGRAKGDRTPHDTAVRVYGTIMPESGHYVIGQRGECTQLVPEDSCAWHVGGRGSDAYWRDNWQTKTTAWWAARWPDLDSPRELAGGRLWSPYIVPPTLAQRIRRPLSWGRGSANAGTYGLEIVPPVDSPTGPWSPDCWRTLARLVLDIHARRSMPLTREHVISHSDAHPIARSTARGPWDPSPSQWSWVHLEHWLSQV